jgi:hypothetical protein
MNNAMAAQRAREPANTTASATSAAPPLVALDLDRFTQAATMRALLQAQLPGFADDRLRIDRLAVRNARRNTSQQRNPRPMTLCYELQCTDTALQRTGTQLLYAEVYRHAADAQAAVAQQDARQLEAPAFGEPLVCLPALNLALWALPNDPGLPQLTRLLDADRAASRVRHALDDGSSRGSHATAGPRRGEDNDDVRVELLRYEPRHRATLRYSVASPHGGAPRTVYAKTFRDDRAAAIDERFRYFWSLAQADDSAPLVAQPLGFDAETRTVWQAPALGVPLRQVVLAVGIGRGVLERVAHALARLHAAPLAPTGAAVQRSVAHWLAEVRRRCQKITRIDAALEPRVARIAAAIEAQAERQARRPLSLIHGDFHPDQVWVQDGRVLLFDFDEFTLGDPMEDVAEFVLKLEQDGAAPDLVAAFVDGCAAAEPLHFDRASLAWHLAIQNLLQASRAFVYQQPGWAKTLERRLAACEARVAALHQEPTA